MTYICPKCKEEMTLSSVGSGLIQGEEVYWQFFHRNRSSSCDMVIRSDGFDDFCNKNKRQKYKMQVLERYNKLKSNG